MKKFLPILLLSFLSSAAYGMVEISQNLYELLNEIISPHNHPEKQFLNKLLEIQKPLHGLLPLVQSAITIFNEGNQIIYPDTKKQRDTVIYLLSQLEATGLIIIEKLQSVATQNDDEEHLKCEKINETILKTVQAQSKLANFFGDNQEYALQSQIIERAKALLAHHQIFLNLEDN